MRVESPEIDPWVDRNLNLYSMDDNDPINQSDPSGLAPVPTTQPTYGGTFLDKMSPAAAAALAKAIVAASGADLSNAQAFSIPLTNSDALIYLHEMGADSLAVTAGMMRNGIED